MPRTERIGMGSLGLVTHGGAYLYRVHFTETDAANTFDVRHYYVERTRMDYVEPVQPSQDAYDRLWLSTLPAPDSPNFVQHVVSTDLLLSPAKPTPPTPPTPPVTGVPPAKPPPAAPPAKPPVVAPPAPPPEEPTSSTTALLVGGGIVVALGGLYLATRKAR